LVQENKPRGDVCGATQNKNKSQVLNRLVVPGYVSSQKSKTEFPFPPLGQIYKEEHDGGHSLDLSMSLVMLMGASD